VCVCGGLIARIYTMYTRLHKSTLHGSHKLFTNKIHMSVCRIGSNNFVDVWNKLEHPHIGQINDIMHEFLPCDIVPFSC
jgi:hypothetical protein